ncbi:Os08g0564200 [Oryza sativa Japonica Group]|uniref:Os08g0564200 protein n=1 Tax=Oryza sativa subsp. japonica TaxID=39947 RepID=A0A0P0XIB1_ORYSJ|nr:hypothetical protein EE612_045977 [Oryza sativa]BAT06735.1 Os08g0564200 [Oryza sativa Japonica Group]
MTHQDQTTVPLVQCLSQRIDGLNVQMVRRLVKQQQLRLPVSQPRKDDAAPLPIREIPHWHHLRLPRQAKLTNCSPHLLLLIPRVFPHHVL